jgi:hypothetical protein
MFWIRFLASFVSGNDLDARSLILDFRYSQKIWMGVVFYKIEYPEPRIKHLTGDTKALIAIIDLELSIGY